LFVAALFAIVGAVSALAVPDEEAAETMHPRHDRQQTPELRAAETG
jgi:hypothetical protein